MIMLKIDDSIPIVFSKSVCQLFLVYYWRSTASEDTKKQGKSVPSLISVVNIIHRLKKNTQVCNNHGRKVGYKSNQKI